MPTQNIMVKPSEGWKLVYSGPITALAVEKNNGDSSAFLAVDTQVPSLSVGHAIENGVLRSVDLEDGESLYIKCNNNLSAQNINVFTITD